MMPYFYRTKYQLTMTNEITQEDYEHTLASGMIDVTNKAESIVDIWPYVELLVKQNLALSYVCKKQLVEKVYRSADNKHDHVVLPTDDQNNFIVLIIDLNSKTILGHHILNLAKLYS
jgi:hypothetical protein